MPDNDVVMLFFPLAIMEPIRGLKPDACSLTWISMCTGWNNYRISSFFFTWMVDLITVNQAAQCVNIFIQILGATPIQYLSKGNHILLLM